MRWRGLVAVVTLLATGIVGGFALAAYLEPSPVVTGRPTPVAAAEPSFPVDPPMPMKPDPTEPPLGTGLPMREVSVGTPTSRFCFPAPADWVRIETVSNEVKYKLAGNPDNTFILRVEQVLSQHEQIPNMVKRAVEDMERDQEQVKIPLGHRTYDSLVNISYVYDGYRRFAFRTWLDVTNSGQAEAEIAITGRAVDVVGMEELMAKVIAGIRAC